MLFKIISIDKAKQNVIDFVRFHYHEDFKNLKDFIKLDINKELFLEIKKGLKKSEDELLQLLKEAKKYIERDRIKEIEKLWKENEREIILTIKDITGIEISTENITCYFDPFTKLGFYGEKHVCISSKIEMKNVLFVIAHELFHIFYFKKIKELSLKIDQEKEWNLSEIAVYLLQEDGRLKKFWPKSENCLYPELKNMYEKVKNYWNLGFDNFLFKSYDSIK